MIHFYSIITYVFSLVTLLQVYFHTYLIPSHVNMNNEASMPQLRYENGGEAHLQANDRDLTLIPAHIRAQIGKNVFSNLNHPIGICVKRYYI